MSPGRKGLPGPKGRLGPQGSAGVLAFTQWTLPGGGVVGPSAIPFNSDISGGGGVGGTGQGVSSFLLQPGIYQVQFYAKDVNPAGCASVSTHLDNATLATWPCPATDGATLYGGTIIGVQIVQVVIPNQTLTFISNGQWGYSAGATLILSRWQ